MIRKRKKQFSIAIFVIFVIFGLSAYLLTQNTATRAAAPADESLTPQSLNTADLVSASGEIRPKQSALLSFSTGGTVRAVPFSTGDFVRAGEVLARLDGEPRLQAAVAAARLELTSAEVALTGLYQDTDLLAAQALQSAETAEQALADLYNLELQQALAEQRIADAQKAVEDTGRRLRYTQSTASQADIDAQKAQVILAEDALDKAREDFEPYANKPETNLTRANLQARLAAAQQRYDAAVRKLNALQGTGSEVDINVAGANYAAAQAELLEAERDLAQVMDGPDAGEIALLEAQIASSYRDYETYLAGPAPDDITLAEERIANAQAQLAAAKDALNNLVLTAPFDGVIAERHINPDEWVSPGSPILLIANLEDLQIETTDLSEVDVAQIAVGDLAQIAFDALPGANLSGTITNIAPKADPGAGVNYAVTIDLEDPHPLLRWGMTAFVDIEVTQ